MNGAVHDLRILADDLTGALDSAAAFGAGVPVCFDRPTSGFAAGAPVSAVATATRDVPASALDAALAPAIDWLRGAGIAFKKVDSLLRGNSFAETALVARAGGFERVLFAPAFPRQGRYAVGGRLVIAPPGGYAGDAGEGDLDMAAALAAAGITRPMLQLPDTRSDEDLLRIAASALAARAVGPLLCCGSAGLAFALAKVLGHEPVLPPADPPASPLMLVSASHHAVVRRQWSLLLAGQQAAIVVRDGDAAALDAACRAMASPFDLALFDLAPAAPMDAAAAAALLAAQLAQIARHAPRPGVLVVVGGDTLRALCRATAATGLLASASARAGWGRARWVGGPWDGLPCHSRSGAFGGEADLAEQIAALRG